MATRTAARIGWGGASCTARHQPRKVDRSDQPRPHIRLTPWLPTARSRLPGALHPGTDIGQYGASAAGCGPLLECPCHALDADAIPGVQAFPIGSELGDLERHLADGAVVGGCEPDESSDVTVTPLDFRRGPLGCLVGKRHPV